MQMTRMKSKDAITVKEIPLVNQENYPSEDTLPKDGLYCCLLRPGENTITSTREPLIGYALRRLTD